MADLLKNPRAVIVEWNDCETAGGWLEEPTVKEYISQPLSIVRSVGWLIAETDKWIILAQSIDWQHDLDRKTGELVKIPKPMVRDWWDLDMTHPFDKPKTANSGDVQAHLADRPPNHTV